MTIRMLENGYYRQLQNLFIRDIEESGRLLESGYLRNKQDGGTRKIEDACCAYSKSRQLTASQLQISNQPANLIWNCKVSCGSLGNSACNASYQWQINVVTQEPPFPLTFLSSCIQMAPIQCGNFQSISGFYDNPLGTGVTYRLTVSGWRWNGCPSPASPTWILIQDFIGPE